jgi:hypothetical protein
LQSYVIILLAVPKPMFTAPPGTLQLPMWKIIQCNILTTGFRSLNRNNTSPIVSAPYRVLSTGTRFSRNEQTSFIMWLHESKHSSSTIRSQCNPTMFTTKQFLPSSKCCRLYQILPSPGFVCPANEPSPILVWIVRRSFCVSIDPRKAIHNCFSTSCDFQGDVDW